MSRWAWLLMALLLLLPCAAIGEESELPQKVVYLTFDDGPLEDTHELLAILEELDVPATFFLMGVRIGKYPEQAKRIVQAGHAVGNHSFAHTSWRIKESLNYVKRDFPRFEKAMREHADPTFTTDLYRFPGGSTHYSPSTKMLVRDEGYAWFDWNAQNNDTRPGFKGDQAMIDDTLRSVGKQDVVILLMHDGKSATRRTLPAIVEALRERGYVFRKLSTSTEDRAILARCSAKMMLPKAEETEGDL